MYIVMKNPPGGAKATYEFETLEKLEEWLKSQPLKDIKVYESEEVDIEITLTKKVPKNVSRST